MIVTDPGYFHFVPAAETCGARIVPIELNASNGYKLQPLELEVASRAHQDDCCCDRIPLALCRHAEVIAILPAAATS